MGLAVVEMHAHQRKWLSPFGEAECEQAPSKLDAKKIRPRSHAEPRPTQYW